VLPQPAPAHGHPAQADLAQALQQAQAALLRANPNPRVGCVLVNPAGQVIGQGSTQQAGGPHAEVMALRDAQALGHSTAGATAYVTLEPCSHHGRTGPCCDALVHAGIGRVVAALPDPNPLVAGQGFARLRAAGVAVDIAGDSADPALRDWAAAARELNIGFFSRMLRGTPWVRLKTAASLDGVTALPNGQSQWITGEAARADGHAWRARACAVLTGIGTVLQDRPRLDVRGIDTPRQPALVVVDSDLQTPPDAALFAPRRPVLIYAATPHAALPSPATSFALKRPGQIGRDPPAIKTAGLRNNPRAAHGAIEIVGVESDAVRQRLCAGQGLRITPGDLCQATRAVNQIPIPRRALPLAKRAAACRAQQRTIHIGQREVERGWVRGLAYRPSAARSRHLQRAPTHHDFTLLAHQFRRAREIPHGRLSWRRDVGKRWTVCAAPAPLGAGLG